MCSQRMPYGALLLDLDGTLIGRDERVSPRVAKAVRKAATLLKVSIVTGRNPADVLRFAKELGLTAPQVSDNGSLVFDPAGGAELWSAPLGPDLSRPVIERLRAKGVGFSATGPGGRVTDADELTRWDFRRISGLHMDEAMADQVAAEIGLMAGVQTVKAYTPSDGGPWVVNVTRAGVDKGAAVRELAKLTGVAPDRMIAAGDSYNDLSMLEACGLSIVMGDAPEELKAVADYVVPSVDDDGLAVALEELVIPLVT